MTRVDPATQKRHVYKRMQSPVGRLTLVATDEGLAAILWENDRPRRVRLNIEAEEKGHPVLVETERQLGEYFAGRRKQFALQLDLSGTAFQRRCGARC
jgi:methylated-DNA-[protein]-cysteine S-methyltransferase